MPWITCNTGEREWVDDWEWNRVHPPTHQEEEEKRNEDSESNYRQCD